MQDDYIKERIETGAFLERKIQLLQRELSNYLDEYRELKKQLVEHCWNVKAGSIVTDNGATLHKVSEVVIRQGIGLEYIIRHRPWVKGNPMRKDGTYGTGERNLYDDWDIADE